MSIVSCKSTAEKQPEEHVGFWAYSTSAYLELKKNGDFEFFWGQYTNNEAMHGIYKIDYEKKDLILYMKDSIQIWQFEMSDRKWIIFLMDLQNYKYQFYKTDKDEYFKENFEKSK